MACGYETAAVLHVWWRNSFLESNAHQEERCDSGSGSGRWLYTASLVFDKVFFHEKNSPYFATRKSKIYACLICVASIWFAYCIHSLRDKANAVDPLGRSAVGNELCLTTAVFSTPHLLITHCADFYSPSHRKTSINASMIPLRAPSSRKPLRIPHHGTNEAQRQSASMECGREQPVRF